MICGACPIKLTHVPTYTSALLKLYLDMIKMHLLAENKVDLRGSKVIA